MYLEMHDGIHLLEGFFMVYYSSNLVMSGVGNAPDIIIVYVRRN